MNYQWKYKSKFIEILLSCGYIVDFEHGTIIQTGIKYKILPLQKSIEFGMPFK